MPEQGDVIYEAGLLTDYDIYLFREGSHYQLYEKLGAHPLTVEGAAGTAFAVWAPNAASVSVIGSFNGWNTESCPLRMREDGSGIWEGFIPGVGHGVLYKYHVVSRHRNYRVDKADPLAFSSETPPHTASVVWDTTYAWNDGAWMQDRFAKSWQDAPVSVYEVHLGSWRRGNDPGGRFQNYREAACELAEYVEELGFTHVEFLPLAEHPFYGSWGYQTLGYFAPKGRYGTPQDCRYMIDRLHRHGIGVILDWVPSHFPDNEYGLVYFDGTRLYEDPDPRRGVHPQWKSYIFNYGRPEVRSFLISSALFWLEQYHADALRVDAVTSMLYLDFARGRGEWIPNRYGGKENLEAIQFIRSLNRAVEARCPGVGLIAEESSTWQGVTLPVGRGGLGFGMKWNMGWMHDTLEYFGTDPWSRADRARGLPFTISYAFEERFILPLSHDEVVYGKGSLIGRMPGAEHEPYAHLRLLFGYMFTHPGKKLLFMGGEFGQWAEWNHDRGLDWHLLDYAPHRGVWCWIRDINRLYRTEPALHERDFDRAGFLWIDPGRKDPGIISFARMSGSPDDTLLVVCNTTARQRDGYRLKCPSGGCWREIANSDAERYGGSGIENAGRLESNALADGGGSQALGITLPALSILIFKREGAEA
ncbi:MAG: 1,4-alpha-glucan branching protein GlgB [Methanomicrobiaceae archaeon]|nr:1,4-alpha-glucan branching protein GlgB [Methanomicrobiaceae archaeon]